MASRWQSLKDKLFEPFRVTVIRQETFEEVNSYSINLANVIAIGLAIVVFVCLLTFGILAITPLRTLLPGFGAINERSELVELNRQLREMEKQMAAQEAYAMNVQRILVGDIEGYDAAVAETVETNYPDSALNVDRIPEDEELRRQVANARFRYRNQGSSSSIPIDQLQLVAPLTGTVSSGFDPSDRHFGIDVVAPAETPIKNILDGYVVEAGWTLETGNVIAIQHVGDLLSFYKHNSTVLKKRGDFVQAGEAVAIIGNTGTRTDGPHLHFELWHRGQPINPVDLLRFE